jgi:hypothetical protein
MDYGDRWSKAKAAATNAIRGNGPGDRASLVLFSTGAEVAVRSAGDRTRLEAGWPPRRPVRRDTLRSGLEARRQPARRVGAARREIILISDFQRRGWEQTPGRDDVKLPERTTLTPVNVASGEPSNLSVTPISLQRTRFENHDRVGGHRRRREPQQQAGVERHAVARGGRQSDPVAAGQRRRRRVEQRDLHAVHRRLAQHARHGAAA